MRLDRMERWEALRARGRRRFIMEYGVLRWGLPTAALWALGMWLIDGDWRFGRFVTLFMIAIVTFPIGGWLLGGYSWHASESAWRRRQRDE